MGFNRRSVATIDSPEFINITSISPLVSKCEIKVMYVGENRNRSFITKEVATEMAQTLPGCPIVGSYIENKEDFGDHGDQVIIDAEGVKFKKLTKPYGFVAPNSKVWFQKFEDTDEYGNVTIRDYLMTEGYLWTEQYEECKSIVDGEGKPHSMELDENSLKGYWSTDANRGVDFFIVNDAIFSKLCILGDDVEPCFENSTITAPKVSSTFSKDEHFMESLFTMMETLKYTLSNKGGQLDMTDNLNTPVVEEPVVNPEENFSNGEDKVNENVTGENQNNIEEFTQNSDVSASLENPVVESPVADEFAKKDDEEDKKDDNKDDEDKKDNDAKDNADDKKEKEEDDEEDTKKKFELLVEQHAQLQSDFAALKQSYDELVEFKNNVEDKEKDDLIASFTMLSDEDKKEVIENKSKYSLRDIKAELSMLCVDKKVNFNLEEEVKGDKPVTYNLNSQAAEDIPAWVKAVENTQKRLK